MPELNKNRLFFFTKVMTIITLYTSTSCAPPPPEKIFTSDDRAKIMEILKIQQEAWNLGDIPAFMQGYHQSDSMQFVGSRGITLGWQETLKRYQKSYPDTVAMGKLKFDILRINAISDQAAWLTGKFYLNRSIGDANGTFTLIFRKINNEWKIVYDHTGN